MVARVLGGGNDIHLLHMITSLEKTRTLILVLISIGLASEAMGAWVQHAWSSSGLSLIICQMASVSLMNEVGDTVYETLLYRAWHVGCTTVDTVCLAPPGHGVLCLPGNVECVMHTWVGCLGRKGLVSVQ